MISKLLSKGPLLAFMPFLLETTNPYDAVDGEDKNKVFQNSPDDETGLERLKKLFSRHADDPWHPDLIAIIQNASVSLVGGGIYGGISATRYTFIDFIEKNEATQFRSHLDAKRMLSDKMLLSFMKGFSKWGMRVCFFCTSFTVAHTFLSIYRNKRSFWHYSAAGAAAGAIYKFPLGPKGMVAGGFFGTFFGSLFGILKLSMLKLSNMTELEILKHRKELKVARDEWIHDAMKKDQMKKVQKEFEELLLPSKEK